MRIQTFSILAGSEACNARCPFCVSKMTLPFGVDEPQEPEVKWRNFRKACLVAKQTGVITAMFTGKGEPTIFPNQITRFLEAMQEFEFPLIEMQTNGILLAERPEKYEAHLKRWYELGMTTIAISIVHYDPEKNRQIYLPYREKYIDLPALIKMLHEHGFSVRLTCILASGFIDSVDELNKLVAFAKNNKVEQLTVTPVAKPEAKVNQSLPVWDWTAEHHLSIKSWKAIRKYAHARGKKLMTLSHGAVVFDLDGQNLCLNNCLTVNPDSEELRNLIFFPDGHLRYYWQYPGAILL